MKQFDITYYFGPTHEYFQKEEVVADMSAAGFTLCQLFNAHIESACKILPLLKKYGMRATVYEQRLQSLYRNEDFENVDEVVRSVIDDYKDYDNVDSWEICDEPEATKFPIIAKIVEALHKYAPNQEVVVNLFPDYASPEKQLMSKSYTDYVEDFVRIVEPDLLCYDYYPFMGRKLPARAIMDETISERERLIRIASESAEDRDGFFNNLAEIRRIGLENNLEQMLIVQLTEHGGCRNLTPAEIRWEVNMCLAYGTHRISYFTYWLPDEDKYWSWTDSMCDKDGSKFKHYYDVQTINQEILSIGQRLFETKSKEVFHIGRPEKGTVSFESYDNISAIEGVDGVIGFFENGLMYLVNRNFRDENTFTIHTDKELFVYKNNSFFKCGNCHTIKLEPGAAVLMKSE